DRAIELACGTFHLGVVALPRPRRSRHENPRCPTNGALRFLGEMQHISVGLLDGFGIAKESNARLGEQNLTLMESVGLPPFERRALEDHPDVSPRRGWGSRERDNGRGRLALHAEEEVHDLLVAVPRAQGPANFESTRFLGVRNERR